ncbi:unnamed protein product [Caenorhabditis bovis]|uniref:Uncharacterized protein n=1 Tax=Caenorhabditis bovis TaxID=2654633 RepID=A0A8S1FDD9_9PELO|nr:unnamed protein product [Caenorhabditis bovis]
MPWSPVRVWHGAVSLLPIAFITNSLARPFNTSSKSSVYFSHLVDMKYASLFFLPLTCSMVVWPVLDNITNATHSLVKPKNWAEKNLGQWCRNFTVNIHTQCPQASAFHQFDCCGPHETDCCFAIQGWVIVYGAVIGSCSIITLIFSLLLKHNVICLPTYPTKSTYRGTDI